MKKYFVEIPMKIISEANTSSHWAAKGARVKKVKKIIKMMLARCDVKPPCLVKLTRVAPRKLDEHDNLPAAFKYVIDAIADFLVPGKAPGFADSCKDIKWELCQEKGEPKTYQLRVEIYANTNTNPGTNC